METTCMIDRLLPAQSDKGIQSSNFKPMCMLSQACTHVRAHAHTQIHTLRPTQRRSLQMLDVAVPQIGVGVFHA